MKLALLGGFRAETDAGAPVMLPSHKSQALLAYLAIPPGQAHPREKVADLLWGEVSDAQARGNLRQALSRIRKILPEAVQPGLVLDGPTVSLDPSIVDVDVARLERLVADGRPAALQRIPDVYQGDLLAGLALGVPSFEQWLTAQRERLRELAIQGLNHLLSHQQRTGDIEPAIQTGMRLLALDPLLESVHRAVIRLYVQLGRRDAALHQYQTCADVLERELRALPDTETQRLHEQIVGSRHAFQAATPAQTSPPTNLPVSASELIGRDDALAEVTALLGVHRLVTLIGPGGIGKTRLGLEVARGLMPACPDGAWVAELAPLSDPGLVPATVAVALGLKLTVGAESPERVASAVGAKRLLLVLDNCEHVIEVAARMAEALLRADPHVRVLATSREPLRTPGESAY
jgi:DNA-binding SARP family transcriptional activator